MENHDDRIFIVYENRVSNRVTTCNYNHLHTVIRSATVNRHGVAKIVEVNPFALKVKTRTVPKKEWRAIYDEQDKIKNNG